MSIELLVSTQEALRRHAKTLRTNSLPLATLIPILNKAADRIDELEARIDELEAEAGYWERRYVRALDADYSNVDPFDNPAYDFSPYDPAHDDR